MSEILEYKCPACGGAIEFDSKLQKMKCPYCDTEFEMEALKQYDEDLKNEKPDEMTWDTTPGAQWQDGETEGMSTYICKSCGGEIIGDENMAAAKCPYCDNPVVMTGKFSGDLRPDYVIPFKVDKKAAKEGLKNHLKGKPFLPKVFKDENHIDEIRGIYVPFWLFDADVDASVRYGATRVRTWSDKDFIYEETAFYSLYREGSVGFSRVPVDGSSKMPDDLMESIEPYDFREAVDFQTAYLAGYMADKYDVTAENSMDNANARIKNSTEQLMASTVHTYSTIIPEYSNIRLSNGKAKYALYPVWILNTTWDGKKYTFAMNGQTGKFVGDLPVDKKAFNKWTGILTVIFSIIVYLLIFLFM